ncbi:hypothetical protein CCMA1212_010192 [Trichoderma ghanense]|uniref:Uncharacterized protein n=1 Tax=Trichoderma ghanense TaxID=65468 RepID=A0ABY2GRV6_9HYPO
MSKQPFDVHPSWLHLKRDAHASIARLLTKGAADVPSTKSSLARSNYYSRDQIIRNARVFKTRLPWDFTPVGTANARIHEPIHGRENGRRAAASGTRRWTGLGLSRSSLGTWQPEAAPRAARAAAVGNTVRGDWLDGFDGGCTVPETLGIPRFQSHRHPQAGLTSRGHRSSRAFSSPAPQPADATPSFNPPSLGTRAAIGSGAGPTRMMRPEGPARRPSLTQMPDAWMPIFREPTQQDMTD